MLARRALIFTYLCLLISCVKHEAARQVTDLDVTVTSNEGRIIEVRSGNVICQGYLLEKRKVLVDPTCYQGGQKIVVRRLGAPAIEMTGHLRGKKLGEYSVIEVDQDLAEGVSSKPVGAVAKGEKEQLYFYGAAQKSWYLAEVSRDSKEGAMLQNIPAVNTPMFRVDGTFAGFTSPFLIKGAKPQAESAFEKDADYKLDRQLSFVDQLTASLMFRLPTAVAVIKPHKKPIYGANIDVGFRGAYNQFSAEAMMVMGILTGGYYRVSYEKALFSRFDDRAVSVRPFIGSYAAPGHVGLWTGLELYIAKHINLEVGAITRNNQTALMTRLGILQLFLN